MGANPKLLGKRSYRISIDRKIQREMASSKKANLADPVFETMEYFAQKFAKSKGLQKEIASVLSYFVLRHWNTAGRVLARMEEDFNYIIVLLKHKGMKLETAAEFAALIYRASMLMGMHEFTLAHAFDAHLKKELRKTGMALMIHYIPELEIHEKDMAKGSGLA